MLSQTKPTLVRQVGKHVRLIMNAYDYFIASVRPEIDMKKLGRALARMIEGTSDAMNNKT